MKNIYSNIYSFNKKLLKKTVESLKQGKIAGLPTDAKPGAIDDNILINVALFFVPIYMILYLFSIYFFSLYKIDQDTHESNLALINKR